VHEIDEGRLDEDSVRLYIQSVGRRKGIKDIAIERINIGSYRGNIQCEQDRIEKTRMAIAAVDRALCYEQDQNTRNTLYDKKQSYGRYMQMAERRLQGHYATLRDNPDLLRYSVAFVTLSKDSDADILVGQSGLGALASWLAATCPCSQEYHEVERAPEPDDIRWEYIGFTEIERIAQCAGQWGWHVFWSLCLFSCST